MQVPERACTLLHDLTGSTALLQLDRGHLACDQGALTNDNGGVTALVDLPVIHWVEALISASRLACESH